MYIWLSSFVPRVLTRSQWLRLLKRISTELRKSCLSQSCYEIPHCSMTVAWGGFELLQLFGHSNTQQDSTECLYQKWWAWYHCYIPTWLWLVLHLLDCHRNWMLAYMAINYGYWWLMKLHHAFLSLFIPPVLLSTSQLKKQSIPLLSHDAVKKLTWKELLHHN